MKKIRDSYKSKERYVSYHYIYSTNNVFKRNILNEMQIKLLRYGTPIMCNIGLFTCWNYNITFFYN